MSSSTRTVIAVVLAVLGIIAVIIGILYATETARQLPSFLPGAVAKGHHGSLAKHPNRGYVAIAIGVVLLLAAAGSRFIGRTTTKTPGRRAAY